MERFPGSDSNKAEESSERILSSEEVTKALSEYVEGYTLTKERSDEQGVYLREVEVKGEKEGEVTEYQYIRKGYYPNNIGSLETRINVIYFQDGVPIRGDSIAVFNDETGEWRKL
jgi:hypothetical protein